MIKAMDILNLKPEEYKLHLATTSEDGINPLNVFVQDKDKWKGWQSYRGSRNEWTREYVFSLIQYNQYWLFGGIFKVLNRYSTHYEVELTNMCEGLIGRLVISGIPSRRGQGRSFNMETYYNEFTVHKILEEEYNGQDFPGYENINIDFVDLEAVFRYQKIDWKGALENVKGVYAIVDKSNGKKYVGSAYGKFGIWSRWAVYVGTGHGFNNELTKLISEKGINYARQNFRFSLLEYRSMKIDDKVIIYRESYWKEALMTRGQFGYNKN